MTSQMLRYTVRYMVAKGMVERYSIKQEKLQCGKKNVGYGQCSIENIHFKNSMLVGWFIEISPKETGNIEQPFLTTLLEAQNY